MKIILLDIFVEVDISLLMSATVLLNWAEIPSKV